ncbi:MAG: porin family protein [Gammaproteobacteria bacterium]|nr:porin family protein [Gammaproteobacteria bacterium]
MNTNKRCKGLLLATLFVYGLATSLPTLAESPTWFGKKATGTWMAGIKAGNMINEGTDFSDSSNVGLLVGYTFAKPIGDAGGSTSVEFEMTTSADRGTFGNNSALATTGKWDVESKALYVAYRSAGTVYFKGKLGGVIADITTERDSGATSNDTVEDAKVSLGAGLGMRISEKANIELEWASGIGENDINYVSLGAVFNF